MNKAFNEDNRKGPRVIRFEEKSDGVVTVLTPILDIPKGSGRTISFSEAYPPYSTINNSHIKFLKKIKMIRSRT